MTVQVDTSPTPRVAFLGMAALMVTIPMGNLGVGPLQLVQAMAMLAVLVVLTTAAIRLRLTLPPWPIGLPLFAMVVVAALASRGTPVPDVSFRINAALVVGVLLVVSMWSVVDRPSRLRTLVLMLVLAGAGVGVLSLAQAGGLSTAAGGAIVRGRVAGIFAQPNELGVFAAMLLPVAVALAFARVGVQRLLAYGCALAIGSALVLSLSRGAWFGAGIGILVLLMQLPNRARAMGALAAGLVAVGATVLLLAPRALIAVVGRRIASVTTPGVDNPYDERDEIYAEASRQIVDSPVLGHGPGAFTMTARRLTQDGYDLSIDHAHSLVLVAATEYGLLGLLSLLALGLGLTWMLYRFCWRHRRGVTEEAREVTTLASGLFAGLVAVSAHGMVDYPLRNPVSGMTVWIVIALTAASIRCAQLLSSARTEENAA